MWVVAAAVNGVGLQWRRSQRAGNAQDRPISKAKSVDTDQVTRSLR